MTSVTSVTSVILSTASANANLYVALRAGFPRELDGCALETDTGLRYSWRDLEDSSAMVANLLAFLQLPPGARVAVQVEKSVEALVLYLACLRAGVVYLPLNTAYQSAEMAYFLQDAQPAVVVCSGKNFGWTSKMAFLAGTRHVFTLNDDRTGSLLDRAAQFPRTHAVAAQRRGRSGRDHLHQWHHRAQQGRDAEHMATCCPTRACCSATGAGRLPEGLTAMAMC